jgi:hypothetical protein
MKNKNNFQHRGKVIMLCSLITIGCATPTVVQSVKPGDAGLSCSQLQNEYADAENYRLLADKEKSVTGGNVVRAILFWPAILGTASNANEAIAAANSRKVYLANQMSQKNCSIPVTPTVAVSSKEQSQIVASGKSKETQLAEIKKLYEDNLITKEVYENKQKTILDTQAQ